MLQLFRAGVRRAASSRRALLPMLVGIAGCSAVPALMEQSGNLYQAGKAAWASPSAGAASGALASAAAASMPTLSPDVPCDSIAQYRLLLAKGTLAGADLTGLVSCMRFTLARRHNATAWSTDGLQPDSSLNVPPNGDLISSLVTDTVMRALMSVLESSDAPSNVAAKPLDDFLAYVLDDRRHDIDSMKISVPSPDGMTDAQVKRTVTLVMLIVTSRVADIVLDGAQKDLAKLQIDYGALLKQREDAATLLFAALEKRRGSQGAADPDLARTLDAKDLDFIDKQLGRMTVQEFAHDMAAQNLAIQYLRSKDPTAFQDYRVKVDNVVARTRAYVRTIVGVSAFGTLSVVFGHTVVAIARENNWGNAIATMPLGIDFLKASGPVAVKSASVAAQGIQLAAGCASWNLLCKNDEFIVATGDKAEKVPDPPATFKRLQAAGESDTFVSALFISPSASWLNRVRLCDPLEAGQMLDAAVPRDAREQFGYAYFNLDKNKADDVAASKSLLFANLFTVNDPQRPSGDLPERLFDKDQRRQSDSLAISAVQKAVEANFNQWNEEQLLRLVFHNREGGPATLATLDVVNFHIRPIPSADAVYAYEVGAEACRRTTEALALPAPVPAPPVAVDTSLLQTAPAAAGLAASSAAAATRAIPKPPARPAARPASGASSAAAAPRPSSAASR
jgi:hypothetical protein